MEATQRYTLGKNERLKSRKLIEKVFKEGKSFSLFPFRVVYLLGEAKIPVSNLQSGFTAGTKYFKKAVDRNRVKRLMKEAYRLQKNELQLKMKAGDKNLAVFFIYTGNELPEYKLIDEKMAAALKRLKKIVDEDSAANT